MIRDLVRRGYGRVVTRLITHGYMSAPAAPPARSLSLGSLTVFANPGSAVIVTSEGSVE
jgi:hypothetical protein